MSDKPSRWFNVWFGITAVISVVVMVVFVWALIKAVNHFT